MRNHSYFFTNEATEFLAFVAMWDQLCAMLIFRGGNDGCVL